MRFCLARVVVGGLWAGSAAGPLRGPPGLPAAGPWWTQVLARVLLPPKTVGKQMSSGHREGARHGQAGSGCGLEPSGRGPGGGLRKGQLFSSVLSWFSPFTRNLVPHLGETHRPSSNCSAGCQRGLARATGRTTSAGLQGWGWRAARAPFLGPAGLKQISGLPPRAGATQAWEWECWAHRLSPMAPGWSRGSWSPQGSEARVLRPSSSPVMSRSGRSPVPHLEGHVPRRQWLGLFLRLPSLNPAVVRDSTHTARPPECRMVHRRPGDRSSRTALCIC